MTFKPHDRDHLRVIESRMAVMPAALRTVHINEIRTKATPAQIEALEAIHGRLVAIEAERNRRPQPKADYSLPAEQRPLLTYEQKVGLVKLAGVGAAGSAAVAGGVWLFANFGLWIAAAAALWFVGSALFGGRREEEYTAAPVGQPVYNINVNVNAGNGTQNT